MLISVAIAFFLGFVAGLCVMGMVWRADRTSGKPVDTIVVKGDSHVNLSHLGRVIESREFERHQGIRG